MSSPCMAGLMQLVSLAFIKGDRKIPKVMQKWRGGGLCLQAFVMSGYLLLLFSLLLLLLFLLSLLLCYVTVSCYFKVQFCDVMVPLISIIKNLKTTFIFILQSTGL